MYYTWQTIAFFVSPLDHFFPRKNDELRSSLFSFSDHTSVFIIQWIHFSFHSFYWLIHCSFHSFYWLILCSSHSFHWLILCSFYYFHLLILCPSTSSHWVILFSLITLMLLHKYVTCHQQMSAKRLLFSIKTISSR